MFYTILKCNVKTIIDRNRRDFSVPISLHDCVHYLYIAFAPMKTEFQVGKSRPRLQPCFGENVHLGCFFITKKIKYFLNETFRQHVSHGMVVRGCEGSQFG
ncbi:hypothetical protein H5410_029880 [Solanum commersonii]|uniref:Uncharacterized protein n=1 Tax=Solanum commersonii TaxID=4109 RepID=A0A9J5YHM6_SOLCO|nr:hypothetical protein H5410_029880 [Solanum commersonii]